MKHPAIKKNIKGADEWLDMKFEQVFKVPMKDYRVVELDSGRLDTFRKELNRLIKHVDKNKGPSGVAKLLFTTGAKVKSSPEYAKLYDDFIDIQHSVKGRDITNGLQYQKVLDSLQLEAIARARSEGDAISKRQFNKSIKQAKKLWDKQMKEAVDAWNEVPGADRRLNEITSEIKEYVNKGEGKVFFDFINVIEKELPKIGKEIETLAQERIKLKEKGEDYSHIRKKYDEIDLLGGVVESQHLRNAVKDYLELMGDNFVYMNQGINAYINSVKAGLDAKGWDRGNIDIISSKLKKELLPDKKAGYYPHFSTDINAEFLNGLMLKFDRISELTAPQSTAEVKSGQTMEQAVKEALRDTEGYITSEVSRFNFMAHTQWKTREAINMLKKRFKEGKDIDGYGSDIVNLIQTMHFDMTGQRAIKSPEFQGFLRTVLNLEYVSKIGGNFRTAGKNLSQYLVNWVEHGGRRMKEAKRFYEQNPEMSDKVDQILKESGLFYEEAPRELEEGAALGSSRVKLSENFELEFKNKSFWEKSAEKTSGIAGSKLMSGMMRKVENINRKSAFKLEFYHIYSMLKNSAEFNNSRIAKGKSAKQIESEIISRARNGAIRSTTGLHYDYSHVTKSAAMKHPVGAVVFQFQHFFNEFTRFNVDKIRGLKSDWANQQFTGPQAMQAYRLGAAYALIPGILSLIFKSDFFNIVEHATYDKANQLFTALTGDEDEIQKVFYGKGVNIAGFAGAPLLGDIITLGELSNLFEVEEDGWIDMMFGFSDYGKQTGDQKAYSLMRLANGQLARFRYRTLPMITSGHAFMGLQNELGLYPSNRIEETREVVMDSIENMSPELETALKELYRESEAHRRRALK